MKIGIRYQTKHKQIANFCTPSAKQPTFLVNRHVHQPFQAAGLAMKTSGWRKSRNQASVKEKSFWQNVLLECPQPQKEKMHSFSSNLS